MSLKKEFLSNDYNVITIPATENIISRRQLATGKHLSVMPQSSKTAIVRVQFGEGSPDIRKAVRVFPGDSFSFEDPLNAFYIWVEPSQGTEAGDEVVLLIGNKEIVFKPSPQIISNINDQSLRNDFFGAGLNSLASAVAFFENPKYKFAGGNSVKLAFSLNYDNYPDQQSFFGGGNIGGLDQSIFRQNGTGDLSEEAITGALYKSYLVEAGADRDDQWIRYSDEPGGFGSDSLLWMEMDCRGNFDELVYAFGWALWNDPDGKPGDPDQFPTLITGRNQSSTQAKVLNFTSIPNASFQETMSNVFHQGSFKNPNIEAKKNLRTFIARDKSQSAHIQTVKTMYLSAGGNKIENAFIDVIPSSRVEASGPVLGWNVAVMWYGNIPLPSGTINTEQLFFDTRLTGYLCNKQFLTNYFNDLNQ